MATWVAPVASHITKHTPTRVTPICTSAVLFFLVQAYGLSAYALKYKTWKTDSANPGTLGVLYPLLVVRGRELTPEPPGLEGRHGRVV